MAVPSSVAERQPAAAPARQRSHLRGHLLPGAEDDAADLLARLVVPLPPAADVVPMRRDGGR